jgi:hypothetical protein
VRGRCAGKLHVENLACLVFPNGRLGVEKPYGEPGRLLEKPRKSVINLGSCSKVNRHSVKSRLKRIDYGWAESVVCK